MGSCAQGWLAARTPSWGCHGADTSVLVEMADTACGTLPALVEQAMADTSRGPRNSKLARLLAKEVAKRHQLLIQA
jgi:hypothetical protein